MTCVSANTVYTAIRVKEMVTSATASITGSMWTQMNQAIARTTETDRYIRTKRAHRSR